MTELAILIPVLRRPQNVRPLVSSIMDNTEEGVFEILFIASPGDKAEIQELEHWNQSYLVMDASYENKGDYARKINTGFNYIEAKWYFLGADDLKFHPGWFEAAMETYRKSDSCVIGTNDMGNPLVTRGQHSTHSLVLRDYVLECGGSIGEPGKILHEGYSHNFCDTELIETAKWRGAWSFSRDSRVEHLHYNWRKGVTDEVYEIGKKNFHEDQKLYGRRKRLWP